MSRTHGRDLERCCQIIFHIRFAFVLVRLLFLVLIHCSISEVYLLSLKRLLVCKHPMYFAIIIDVLKTLVEAIRDNGVVM